MKKHLFSFLLFATSSSFAFPNYEAVTCTGNINGHRLTIEYNKVSQVFKLEVDKLYGFGYAYEAGNRIYTNPEYDQYGNLVHFELLSNRSNWNAIFKVYMNHRVTAQGGMTCQKLDLKQNKYKETSLMGIMSRLKTKNKD